MALIRLCIRAGWSEPLLVAHTTLLEISYHGSFAEKANKTVPDLGVQWLNGRVLDLGLKGRFMFETHWRQWLSSLSKTLNPLLSTGLI